MRPINLLPPEAFQKLSARRLRTRLILAGALYLALLALLTLVWSGRVSDAEQEVDDAQAANDRLEQQVAVLSEAQTLVEEFDANALLVVEALSLDMSWGRILNDLARLIPDRVWLQSFTGAVDDTGTGPLGSITVAGVGFAYPDVSAWLRSLDSDRFPSVTGTWVQTVSETEIGPVTVVNFSSTTSLTERALSGRLATRVPEVAG